MRREPGGSEGTHAAADGFRPDIQGLRAFAVVVVVLFHAGLGFSGGFLGVDVFFVVSGYVITLLLRRELAATNTIDLGTFWLRRARRLFPALAVVLVVVLLATPLLGPAASAELTRMTGISGAIFGANIFLLRIDHGYFSLESEANPLLHLWSLSVEEQFYLVFPAVVLLVTRVGRGRDRLRSPAVVLAALAVLSFGWSVWLTQGSSGWDAAEKFAFYGAPTRAWEFLVGCLAALWVSRVGPRAAQVCAALGVALLSYAVLVSDGGMTQPALTAVIPVLGTVLVIVAGLQPGNPVTRLLSLGPVQRVGDLSYSWYLWHWPIIVFARSLFPGAGWAPPVAALVSLLPAVFVYHRVEQPLRHHRPMPRLSFVTLTTGCIALPLVAVGLSGAVEQAMPAHVRAFPSAFDPQPERCDDLGTDATPDDCTWVPRAGPSRGHVVLLGDSNAGHLASGFLEATEATAVTATIQTRGACQFVDLYIAPDEWEADACRTYYEDRMDWLLTVRPDLVVIAGVTDRRIERGNRLGASPDGPWVVDPDAKADLWADALERTLAELDDAQIDTLVVHTLPRITGWPDPELCAPLRVLVAEATCGATVTTAGAREFARRALDAEEEAIARVERAGGLDLWPDLCPDGTCPAFREEQWWFIDSDHLSAYGSRQMAGAIREAIEDRLGPSEAD